MSADEHDWKGRVPLPPARLDGRCLLAGCGRRTVARGLCVSHYSQWNSHRRMHIVAKPWTRHPGEVKP